MDTKDFTSCVTYLMFMSDTHLNDSRQRSPQKTAIKSSSKLTQATYYNAITQHIAIQNGNIHLTREKKIRYLLNRLLSYSVRCKNPEGYQSTSSFFCKTHSTVCRLNPWVKKAWRFSQISPEHNVVACQLVLFHRCVFSESTPTQHWSSLGPSFASV